MNKSQVRQEDNKKAKEGLGPSQFTFSSLQTSRVTAEELVLGRLGNGLYQHKASLKTCNIYSLNCTKNRHD